MQSKLASLNQETLFLPSFWSLSIHVKLRTTSINPEKQQKQLHTNTKTGPWSVTNALETVTPKNDADKNKNAVLPEKTSTILTNAYVNLNVLTVKEATWQRVVQKKRAIIKAQTSSKLGKRVTRQNLAGDDESIRNNLISYQSHFICKKGEEKENKFIQWWQYKNNPTKRSGKNQ